MFPDFSQPYDYEFNDYYDFSSGMHITTRKYVDLPLCTSCWRAAHDGEWPQGQFKLNVPAVECHKCGHLTESGLFTRKPADE